LKRLANIKEWEEVIAGLKKLWKKWPKEPATISSGPSLDGA
jgi:hypothetical protein